MNTYNILFLAILATTICCLGGIYGGAFNIIQEAEAIICPVDEIQLHSTAITKALQDNNIPLIKQEAQKLLDLTNQLEQDEIAEDAEKYLNLYN